MTNLKLLSVALATTIVAAGCVPGTSTSTQAPAISVPAAPAQRGEIRQALSYTGDVRARDQITVLPKASGRVQQVLVDVGTPVHVGDVIAQLESDSPEIQVLQARANLAAAQAKFATLQAGGKPDDVATAQEALAQPQTR